MRALVCSAGVISTTIQAQDFADVVGDKKIGRVTFPIYAPLFSRTFTLAALVTWSIVLSRHWSLGFWGQTCFCFLGAMTGLRYYNLRISEQDSMSYVFFNVGCGVLFSSILIFLLHIQLGMAFYGTPIALSRSLECPLLLTLHSNPFKSSSIYRWPSN
jgi:4-hydroxybenzoate polyprenyltransferase